MIKLRTTLGKFGEFSAHIAYFWLAWVRRNHFVNTNFSKHSKEIADPSEECDETTQSMLQLPSKRRRTKFLLRMMLFPRH